MAEIRIPFACVAKYIFSYIYLLNDAILFHLYDVKVCMPEKRIYLNGFLSSSTMYEYIIKMYCVCNFFLFVGKPHKEPCRAERVLSSNILQSWGVLSISLLVAENIFRIQRLSFRYFYASTLRRRDYHSKIQKHKKHATLA